MARCPFAFLLADGLQLKERSVQEVTPAHWGVLIHAVLGELVNGATRWQDLSLEKMCARADALLDTLAPQVQDAVLVSSKRYRYLVESLRRVLHHNLAVIKEHLDRGSFYPLGGEISFGRGMTLPPLELKLQGWTAEVRGQIDRIDVAAQEDCCYLRVIDYKKGDRDFHPQELVYGLNLQLPLYLMAALEGAPRLLRREVHPAGFFYFRVFEPVARRQRPLGEDPEAWRELEEELFKKHKMKGLILADDQVSRLVDASEQCSDLIVSGPDRSVSPAELKALLEYTRKQVASWCTRIIRGETGIAPYRKGQDTACTYCCFKPACQFEAGLGGNAYRLLPFLSREETWRIISGEGERDGG
jgi:ATP-dependent helicase/nuclease subunit B